MGDQVTQMHRRNRKWVPDPATIADQLIEDYRDATQQNPNDPLEARGQGDLDAIGTMESWQESAEFHGEELPRTTGSPSCRS
jgi:hypothetical protein